MSARVIMRSKARGAFKLNWPSTARPTNKDPRISGEISAARATKFDEFGVKRRLLYSTERAEPRSNLLRRGTSFAAADSLEVSRWIVRIPILLAPLAQFASTLDLADVPTEVKTDGRRLLLDSIGCTLAAAHTDDSDRSRTG